MELIHLPALTHLVSSFFPIFFVSYVVVRSEVGTVTSGIRFELHDAAVAAHSRFAGLLARALLRRPSPRRRALAGAGRGA